MVMNAFPITDFEPKLDGELNFHRWHFSLEVALGARDLAAWAISTGKSQPPIETALPVPSETAIREQLADSLNADSGTITPAQINEYINTHVNEPNKALRIWSTKQLWLLSSTSSRWSLTARHSLKKLKLHRRHMRSWKVLSENTPGRQSPQISTMVFVPLSIRNEREWFCERMEKGTLGAWA